MYILLPFKISDLVRYQSSIYTKLGNFKVECVSPIQIISQKEALVKEKSGLLYVEIKDSLIKIG